MSDALTWSFATYFPYQMIEKTAMDGIEQRFPQHQLDRATLKHPKMTFKVGLVPGNQERNGTARRASAWDAPLPEAAAKTNALLGYRRACRLALLFARRRMATARRRAPPRCRPPWPRSSRARYARAHQALVACTQHVCPAAAHAPPLCWPHAADHLCQKGASGQPKAGHQGGHQGGPRAQQ